MVREFQIPEGLHQPGHSLEILTHLHRFPFYQNGVGLGRWLQLWRGAEEPCTLDWGVPDPFGG